MSRKAFISSDIAHDEKLYDVAQEEPLAALIFPMLITYFDDWGRAIDSPKRIKTQLFPAVSIVTIDVIERALSLFAEYKLIERYEDEENRYIAIPSEKWFKWQTHIRTEKRMKDQSKYPPCPSDVAKKRETERDNAQVREVARICTPTPSLTLTPTPSKDSDDDDHTHTHARESSKKIINCYEREFGRLPNVTQIDDLTEFVEKGMEIDLVTKALHIARQNAKDAGYALGILRRQYDRGIKTVAQAELYETERQSSVGGVDFEVYSRTSTAYSGYGRRTRSITGGRVGIV